MQDHITLSYIKDPGQNHSARTSIRYKTNQCENMIDAKPPGFRLISSTELHVITPGNVP